MSAPHLVHAIEARFPGSLRTWETSAQACILHLSPLQLETGEWVRDDPAARYDLFLALAPLGEELVYQLASHSRAQRLQLAVPLPDAHDSLSPLWPAANWAEREAHELWGIDFSGHSDLRPLLSGSDPPLSVLAATPHRLIGGARYPASVDGLAVDLELEGERVIAAQPRLGRRHCALGQRLSELAYPEGLALAARIDAFAAGAGDLAYALAIEQVLEVEPPPRAQALRALYAELGRIASHLYWLAGCTQDLAGPSSALPAQAWQGRVEILEWMCQTSENPLFPDLVAIGGLRRDVPPTSAGELRPLQEHLSDLLRHLERAYLSPGRLGDRLRDVGVIDPGTALGLGLTGPCLRACGVNYDVRAAFPYAAYAGLGYQPVLAQEGDALARCQVRLGEIGASLRLIQQLLDRLPGGAINAFAPGPSPASLPAGSAYASVEGPRGELGVLIATDGTATPSRAYIRGPSFANLSALSFITPDATREQAVVALGSLDISVAEVER